MESDSGSVATSLQPFAALLILGYIMTDCAVDREGYRVGNGWHGSALLVVLHYAALDVCC